MPTPVFRELSAALAHAPQYGGKVRGLARLLAAGVRVPEALVLEASEPGEAQRVAHARPGSVSRAIRSAPMARC